MLPPEIQIIEIVCLESTGLPGHLHRTHQLHTGQSLSIVDHGDLLVGAWSLEQFCLILKSWKPRQTKSFSW